MSLDPRKTYGPAWLVLTPQGLAELRVEPDDEVSLVTVAPVEQETVERSRDPLAYGLS